MVKPGWKTTEFWLTLGAGVWAALEPAAPPLVRVAAPVLVSAVYAISRAITKKAAAASSSSGK